MGNVIPQNRELAGRFRSQRRFLLFENFQHIENVSGQVLKSLLHRVSGNRHIGSVKTGQKVVVTKTLDLDRYRFKQPVRFTRKVPQRVILFNGR